MSESKSKKWRLTNISKRTSSTGGTAMNKQKSSLRSSHPFSFASTTSFGQATRSVSASPYSARILITERGLQKLSQALLTSLTRKLQRMEVPNFYYTEGIVLLADHSSVLSQSLHYLLKRCVLSGLRRRRGSGCLVNIVAEFRLRDSHVGVGDGFIHWRLKGDFRGSADYTYSMSGVSDYGTAEVIIEGLELTFGVVVDSQMGDNKLKLRVVEPTDGTTPVTGPKPKVEFKNLKIDFTSHGKICAKIKSLRARRSWKKHLRRWLTEECGLDFAYLFNSSKVSFDTVFFKEWTEGSKRLGLESQIESIRFRRRSWIIVALGVKLRIVASSSRESMPEHTEHSHHDTIRDSYKANIDETLRRLPSQFSSNPDVVFFFPEGLVDEVFSSVVSTELDALVSRSLQSRVASLSLPGCDQIGVTTFFHSMPELRLTQTRGVVVSAVIIVEVNATAMEIGPGLGGKVYFRIRYSFQMGGRIETVPGPREGDDGQLVWHLENYTGRAIILESQVPGLRATSRLMQETRSRVAQTVQQMGLEAWAQFNEEYKGCIALVSLPCDLAASAIEMKLGLAEGYVAVLANICLKSKSEARAATKKWKWRRTDSKRFQQMSI